MMYASSRPPSRPSRRPAKAKPVAPLPPPNALERRLAREERRRIVAQAAGQQRRYLSTAGSVIGRRWSTVKGSPWRPAIPTNEGNRLRASDYATAPTAARLRSDYQAERRLFRR
jgi:hypothetical protein